MPLAPHSTEWANEILGRVWPVDLAAFTVRRKHCVLAVSRLETGHAGGWKGPGVGSNNFGAMQAGCKAKEGACACSVPSFPNLDHDAKGKPYVGCYRIFPSPEAGMEALARRLLRPGIVAGMDTGNADALAAAMRSTGYFEAKTDKYAAALASNAAAVAARLGEPPQLTRSPLASTGGGAGGLLALAGLGALAYALTRSPRTRARRR